MPKDDFSNREIMLMFEQIKTELFHIKEQTTKHNGRMEKIEKRLSVLESLRWVLYGSGVVILYLGIPEVMTLLN